MQTMLNHSLSIEPVDDSKYTTPSCLPAVYYGANIKHRYDCERLNIPGGERIKHSVQSLLDDHDTVRYIHGHPVANPLLVLKLLRDLEPEKVPKDQLLTRYFKHLGKYGLSCSDSYGYIAGGCLTIDGAHLGDISENTELNIFDISTDDPQWYSRYASTHIFILY